MYNTMGWIDRIASEDYKVDDNLTIEAGTVVYINSFGIQLDRSSEQQSFYSG